jgi:hypothetical protein
MSIEEMRRFLVEYYAGSINWAARVAKMKDAQIFAVYMRITNKPTT